MMPTMRLLLLALLAGLASAAAPMPSLAGATQPRDRGGWLALARGGFVLPPGERAVDVLLQMNPLLASSDPVLRDEVAYSAAERWILRDRLVTVEGLRALAKQWRANLEDGLGEPVGDRVFGRSFSALCLSLIAAADLSTPAFEQAEVDGLFEQLLDYFAREKDLRGFDPVHGWMHTVAHTADALKFLARNPRLSTGADRRLLDAVRAKIDQAETVFAWGENDRIALALQSAVRRPDADTAALETWSTGWIEAHRALWAKGPHVDPRAFARVENGKQVMRSLHAALSMEAHPTPTGIAAAKTMLDALSKMR
jgi:hypothetical protein